MRRKNVKKISHFGETAKQKCGAWNTGVAL
jgi:hypothetical protein